MCGRYTLANTNPADVRGRFPVGESVPVRRRYNVAPGDEVLGVRTDREGHARGELLRWGLIPSWSKTASSELKLINARVETVAERLVFRAAWERFRCLILADGFYEWSRSADGRKRAFWITRTDRSLFAFAGLWSSWKDEHGPTLRTCAILTTAANAAIATLHDRMPIILPPGGEESWLNLRTPEGELAELLQGLSASETVLTPVGTAVNDATYDGPACVDPPVEDGQRALF